MRGQAGGHGISDGPGPPQEGFYTETQRRACVRSPHTSKPQAQKKARKPESRVPGRPLRDHTGRIPRHLPTTPAGASGSLCRIPHVHPASSVLRGATLAPGPELVA